MKRTTAVPEQTISNSTNERILVLSELIGRAKLAASLGKQYGGDRDIYQALGYPTDRSVADCVVETETGRRTRRGVG